MKSTPILFVAALLLVPSVARPVRADDTTKQCMTDAKDEYKTKRTALQDEFTAAKDVCRNVNHDCAETCRTAREDCVAVPEAALQACQDGCKTAFKTARDECKQSTADDTPERQACIDTAEQHAYDCRKACRDGADRATLRQCKQTFKTCMQTCAPSAPTN